jgi:hypothetical protein
MLYPGDIADDLVALLKAIPGLVTLLGSADRIKAYHDNYPSETSWTRAVAEMQPGSMLVVYTSTEPGTLGNAEVWKHNFSIFIRAAAVASGQKPMYYQAFNHFCRSVPTGMPQPIPYLAVNASCQPMDPPSIRRQSGEDLDYFEILTSFAEIGDN